MNREPLLSRWPYNYHPLADNTYIRTHTQKPVDQEQFSPFWVPLCEGPWVACSLREPKSWGTCFHTLVLLFSVLKRREDCVSEERIAKEWEGRAVICWKASTRPGIGFYGEEIGLRISSVGWVYVHDEGDRCPPLKIEMPWRTLITHWRLQAKYAKHIDRK